MMPRSLCRISIIASALLVCGVLFGQSAYAMSVNPLVLDLSTASKGAQISVLNDGAKPLPVEVTVSRAELDEKGEMTTKPAGDEFLIFPAQVMIPPGASQSIRLQWVGDPNIPTSQTYVFSFNQVPVKMPESKSGVQVVMNFGALVNVYPPKGTTGINLVSSGVGRDDKGKTRPEITVKNPGNIFSKLTDATIKLSGSGWSETLPPQKLRDIIGVGLLQPGKTRKFLLPVDLPANVTQITASIDYKPGK
jgi:fimbrial chaperone protein